MHSIRIKITAVTVAAVLTSILALGGIGVLSIGIQSDRNSAEKMGLISENMQRKLNAYLNSLEQSVNMAIRIAQNSLSDPAIDYLGPDGPPEKVAALDAALGAHCAAVEQAFSSIANSTNGVITYYYCIDCGYGSNEHGFFWSKLDQNEFTRQQPLISTDLDRDDIEHTTWYYTPLKAGRAMWIGPYKAHYLGEKLTFSYVAPIYHHGFLLGVLGMDILFDTMVQQIQDVPVYESGFVFLMDRNGRLLYHPDVDVKDIPAELDANLDVTLLRRRDSGDRLVRYNRSGQTWQLAFSALNDEYKVAVTAPVSEITAYRRHLTLLVLLMAVVILAVFTVVTLLLMNALTKPLLRLTAASQKLIAGDYDVALDYHGHDEVGILTQAFCQMRDYLKLYIKDLNSRAYTDAMTGVRNKGAMNVYITNLNDQITLGDPENPPEFAVVVFDCNLLKQVNDRYGHDCGDAYLKKASATICGVFAHSPVFRIGGDEFAVLLMNDDYRNREALMQEFDRRAQEINAAATQPWDKVNVSKGLSDYHPGLDENVEQVMRRADEIMYRQKRESKLGRE